MPGIIGTEDGLKIGITYDLKSRGRSPPALPDDAHEEFDSPRTIEAIAAVLRGLGHGWSCSATAASSSRGAGRPARLRVQLRRGARHQPRPRGPRAGGAGDARHPVHRLRPVHAGGRRSTRTAPRGSSRSPAWPCPRQVFAAGRRRAGRDRPGSSGCRFPLIVKPAWEGSSKGIRNKCLVETAGRAGRRRRSACAATTRSRSWSRSTSRATR